MAEVKAKEAKIIQYLNEAYGKEKELETALQAHIEMATRPPYKKRLQQHLRETKNHAKQLERRIKKLGGKADAGPVEAVAAVAAKAAAAAKGPIEAIRGTGNAEKMLKNVKDAFANEAQEIANYRAIEQLADSVGDKDTSKLAKAIRREEERMSSFLEKLIPQLTKAVAQEEIPASERRTGRTTRRRSSARKSAARSTSRAKSSSASSRSKPARGSSSRAKSTTSRSSAAKKSTASRSSTAKKSNSSSKGTKARGTSRSSSSRASTSRNGSSGSARASSSTRRKAAAKR